MIEGKNDNNYNISSIHSIISLFRYTSIGNIENTVPNPMLETKDAIGRVIYLPAHKLKDEEAERKGRLF